MYNEASKRATMKYQAKLKRIEIRLQPYEYNKYKAAAEYLGYTSMRQFVLDAIKEKIGGNICKESGCHYFDGFGCTRSPIVTEGEEACPCDKKEG